MTGNFRSLFLQTLAGRGFIHQTTDDTALDALLSEKKPVTAYIGFDCTADSLHVGSLLPIMALRHLQQSGHKPVVLMGSGTTRIGDPSGKDSARQMLDDAGIARNKQGIQQIFNRYLSFGDASADAVMVDNADWLCHLNYLDFLRDVGSHFSVNRMLSFDSVKLRLEREQPLSFLEFNYMVLQGYDFVELAKRHDCRLQMGGSDQWGNIINGVELGRRMAGLSLFGLTTPLLTTSSGQKMGKTASGAVWLNAERCRPYDFWQYWRNTEDADVERFLKLFTHLPLDEIARLAALQGAEINEAKKILATEVTILCHGTEAAREAAATAEATFTDGGTGAALPVVLLDTTTLAAGISLADVLLRAGLVSSRGEARRLIKAGAVRLDNTPCLEEHYSLTGKHLETGQTLRVSAGKKKHARIQAI